MAETDTKRIQKLTTDLHKFLDELRSVTGSSYENGDLASQKRQASSSDVGNQDSTTDSISSAASAIDQTQTWQPKQPSEIETGDPPSKAFGVRPWEGNLEVANQKPSVPPPIPPRSLERAVPPADASRPVDQWLPSDHLSARSLIAPSNERERSRPPASSNEFRSNQDAVQSTLARMQQALRSSEEAREAIFGQNSSQSANKQMKAINIQQNIGSGTDVDALRQKHRQWKASIASGQLYSTGSDANQPKENSSRHEKFAKERSVPSGQRGPPALLKQSEDYLSPSSQMSATIDGGSRPSGTFVQNTPFVDTRQSAGPAGLSQSFDFGFMPEHRMKMQQSGNGGLMVGHNYSSPTKPMQYNASWNQMGSIDGGAWQMEGSQMLSRSQSNSFQQIGQMGLDGFSYPAHNQQMLGHPGLPAPHNAGFHAPGQQLFQRNDPYTIRQSQVMQRQGYSGAPRMNPYDCRPPVKSPVPPPSQNNLVIPLESVSADVIESLRNEGYLEGEAL